MCKALQQQFISSADFYQWVENKAFKIQLPGELWSFYVEVAI